MVVADEQKARSLEVTQEEVLSRSLEEVAEEEEVVLRSVVEVVAT